MPAAMDDVLSMQLFLIVIGIPIMSLVRADRAATKDGTIPARKRGAFPEYGRYRARDDLDFRPGWARHFFQQGLAGISLVAQSNRNWAMVGRLAWPQTTGTAAWPATLPRSTAAAPWRAEWQLRRADGEYRWMLCAGAPRISPDGVFAGYIVSCSDITDLKRVQEASLARQKLESLGVLAGGIAHDFNNLLGSIHANAEIAEAEGASGSFPAEEIQAIKTISIRASEIVRQLMIYAGHDKSDSEPLDLSRLVNEMLGLIRISISKSAVLKTDLAEDLPAVLGNGPQIQQVVMNLVLNASDALGETGGEITVSTSARPGGQCRGQARRLACAKETTSGLKSRIPVPG